MMRVAPGFCIIVIGSGFDYSFFSLVQCNRTHTKDRQSKQDQTPLRHGGNCGVALSSGESRGKVVAEIAVKIVTLIGRGTPENLNYISRGCSQSAEEIGSQASFLPDLIAWIGKILEEGKVDRIESAGRAALRINPVVEFSAKNISAAVLESFEFAAIQHERSHCPKVRTVKGWCIVRIDTTS